MNLGCARHPHVLRVRAGRQAQSVCNLSAPITLETNNIKLM
ncbi:L-asparaginase [Citrobacter gillenii]|nr:L-asparaginase [Citrobacter gillenii]